MIGVQYMDKLQPRFQSKLVQWHVHGKHFIAETTIQKQKNEWKAFAMKLLQL